ncbi:hypothetical protein [Jannaschia formosa]|uniref:hypothetical protein n=1 Tax=Jannaschia formosa TaxID=2259592 RepID=UPI000E1BCD67|nr:hypothetical protein [Jannaschia formosa]TFL18068.1 hypothetical protein DR046_11525 [Jannaschia formosa]
MIIVTEDTLLNPQILEVRQLPRRFVDRVSVWPRRASPGVIARLLIEMQLLRYAAWLAPLVVVALIWRQSALPLSQAPILMIILVGFMELRVLRAPPAQRAKMDRDAAARVQDLLRVQGRAALTRIAAGRGMQAGALRLVVEQSPLRLLPPLTFVTVQAEDPPRVVDLDEAERAVLAEELFQGALTERALHSANTAEDEFLREVELDARGVSAHARLAAALG